MEREREAINELELVLKFLHLYPGQQVMNSIGSRAGKLTPISSKAHIEARVKRCLAAILAKYDGQPANGTLKMS